MVLKKVALLFFLAVVNVIALHAQVVLPQRGQERDLHDNVFGLGLFGGAGTGLGISFRHHLPSSMSYQITGGIIKANETLSYDIGGEGQYDLVRTSSNRFFVGGGVGYYYSGRSENELEAPGRLCLGLGGEIAVSPGIHGTIELMFTYFTNGNVLPLPQVGFHYYFY
jgi:hypothetical protein